MNYLWLYAAVGAVIVVLYARRQQRLQREAAQKLEAAKATGLGEPPSLHPVIDPSRCIGSSSCVRACPKGALGIVDGKAVLQNASACIGHGVCQATCPFDAISLVFGTRERGIDVPNLSPQFETNIPGIFIAGELGGMGLIRKAAEQGRQAIEALRRRSRGDCDLDVVIVGAGPAGISAGLSAMQHKLRYRLLEQEESLGGAVFHYPRHKVAMTAPVKLALVGSVRFSEVRKEKLLEFWNDVVAKTGLAIAFKECMSGIEADGDGFVVHTDRGRYRTRSVLLALGRRGSPRKLEVPGEESPKVVYRLVDAEQYRGQHVMVVGGGDSALEAAIALAAEPGTTVTLSYRGNAFSRVKKANRDRLAALEAERRIAVLLESTVESIGEREVQLHHRGTPLAVRNDAVIVCAGGQLPTPLLQRIGVRFETKFGTA